LDDVLGKQDDEIVMVDNPSFEMSGSFAKQGRLVLEGEQVNLV